MRIYISGILSPLELEDIKAVLESDSIVYYGGDDNRKRIELIMNCDAIFLSSNWRDSMIAINEKAVAELSGISIVYQSNIENSKTEKIGKIKSAIQEVCGLAFSDYAVKSRNKRLLFARMIFVRQCKNIGMTYKEIAKLLNKKSPCNLINCNKRYDVDLLYDKKFNKIAKRVDELMTNE